VLVSAAISSYLVTIIILRSLIKGIVVMSYYKGKTR
jgi:hypothetical protein